MLAGLKCKFCSKPELNVKHSKEVGFSSHIQVICQNCETVQNECYTCPQEGIKSASINERMVNAFLDMGTGFAGLQKFATNLNMNIMSSALYCKQVDVLSEKYVLFKDEVLSLSREIVRKTHADLGESAREDEIMNITVSYDGTWHTRGHSSNYGIGIVIDVLTGLVLDYIILSKFCTQCSQMEAKMKGNEQEFLIWQKKHRDAGKCEKNFSGSSNSMESNAAEILWQRSVDNCQMRYTTILSDGDASTFSHLSNMNVYPGITLEKQECVNHVGKRLFTALKKVVHDSRIKGVKLGGAKKGSLTEEKMRRLQGYYSNAIKSNAPDVPKMQQAILATLYHCSSSDDSPNHHKCPAGSTSWCFWNKALATNEKPKKHDKMSLYLRPEVVENILPVYERLSDERLLSRCTQIGTQNANESLHHSIWSKCPKVQSTTKKKLEVNCKKHNI